MLETIKRTFFTGLGVYSVTKDKVDSLVSELIEKGNVTEEEGRKLSVEMLKAVERSKTEIDKMIDNRISRAIEKMDLARNSDLERINENIEILKRKIDSQSSENIATD